MKLSDLEHLSPYRLAQGQSLFRIQRTCLHHAYAQARYEALTGWKAPAAGGPNSRQISAAQKVTDRAAKLAISAALGHEREQITAVYLGQ